MRPILHDIHMDRSIAPNFLFVIDPVLNEQGEAVDPPLGSVKFQLHVPEDGADRYFPYPTNAFIEEIRNPINKTLTVRIPAQVASWLKQFNKVGYEITTHDLVLQHGYIYLSGGKVNL